MFFSKPKLANQKLYKVLKQSFYFVREELMIELQNFLFDESKLMVIVSINGQANQMLSIDHFFIISSLDSIKNLQNHCL